MACLQDLFTIPLETGRNITVAGGDIANIPLQDNRGAFIGNKPRLVQRLGKYDRFTILDALGSRSQALHRATHPTLQGFFGRISALYRNENTKKEPLFNDSFGLVAEAGFEPTTFGL